MGCILNEANGCFGNGWAGKYSHACRSTEEVVLFGLPSFHFEVCNAIPQRRLRDAMVVWR
ncbi:MAG: hypothetical protein Q8861_06740 [Bacteroidota bacterium]|nr:hypothetical protein [Bacteroidota bacterium]